MKNILIISTYPNDENMKDGMVRRIKEIDNKLKNNYKRTYINIQLKKIIKEHNIESEELEVNNLNIFYDINKILKLLNQNEVIYVHSLLNFIKILPFIYFKNKKIILDFHGTVPEEFKFQKKYIKWLIYLIAEKIGYRKINKYIFVTNTMKKYYENKYYEKKINEKDSIIYPIIEIKQEIKRENIKNSFKDKIVVVYSGNLQKWQNIDLMMELISKNISDKFFYIVLTGQKEEMEKKFKEKDISNKYFLIDSVLPSELSKYYEISNYGFILRDDHTLNRVANPTKMGEYLDYGIIPIVKLENIGDYKELGYEYITLDKFNDNLPKVKSQKNIEIMRKYREKSEKLDFLKFIED